MKNFLFLPLFCLLLLGCSKEPTIKSNDLKSGEDTELASDRGPNCAITEIRIDNLYNSFTMAHEFTVYKNFTLLHWFRYFKSPECGGQNMYPGVWYPITLLDNTQYQMNYSFKQPCYVLSAAKATFSIRTGGTYITTFPLGTGTTPATNPDIVYFYKSGCAVSEGVIE